jgi:hypothetical protein
MGEHALRRVCNLEQPPPTVRNYPVISVTDRAELRRLLLHIDRAELARAQLQTLVTAADATLVARRRDLRNLRARLRRAAGATPRPGQ